MCYCTVFALFYFIFEGTFKVQAPRGYIRRGDLTEGFLRYEFEGLIFGGAYTLRGLFSEFYGILTKSPSHPEESTALKQKDCCPTWYWLGYHVTFL